MYAGRPILSILILEQVGAVDLAGKTVAGRGKGKQKPETGHRPLRARRKEPTLRERIPARARSAGGLVVETQAKATAIMIG